MTQHNEDLLPPYRVRPRFEIETEYTPNDLANLIKAALHSDNAPCKGRIKHGYATLYLPNEDRHYWSPELTLTIEETENGGSLLRGLYGPRPAVWTMFVFFYSLIGFAIMVIGIVGLSNLSLERSGTILWLIPVLVLAFLTLYLVAFFGQRVGREQMVVLHGFVEGCLGRRV